MHWTEDGFYSANMNIIIFLIFSFWANCFHANIINVKLITCLTVKKKRTTFLDFHSLEIYTLICARTGINETFFHKIMLTLPHGIMVF